MLILQALAYTHPNRDLLFSDINLAIQKHDKVALIGNNGSGKSTLLKLLAGQLSPSAGVVKTAEKPYYVPQLLGQFRELTIAEALGIDEKLNALQEILQGNASEAVFNILDNDWSIEERCREALAHWQLDEYPLSQKMEGLSGGQKTKIFLAGIMINRPQIVLLDEPSNHLDACGRKLLYDYIQTTSNTLVAVSHDRNLLNLLNEVYELSGRGITRYGGNYEFYAEQKKVEAEALEHDLRNKEKALRKAKEIQRDALERKQKLDARGKKKQEKSGVPTIMMNTLRNNAENSTSRMRGVHMERINGISQELRDLRMEVPDVDQMKMAFDHSSLHTGKVLISARDINYRYEHLLWEEALTFQIRSGERLAISGANGSGKTTLIRIVLGELLPTTGTVERSAVRSVYVDQDYSLISNHLTVYEQAQQSNSGALQEHDVKIRLNRFLFTKDDWNKPCSALSGGEKMRLMLCTLTIFERAPDLIILDEPTNNLDLQNLEILTAAINDYRGTLLVVSHDAYFLKQINVKDSVQL